MDAPLAITTKAFVTSHHVARSFPFGREPVHMSVETAMRRIADADDSRTSQADRDQQFEMYRKTLRALEEIDADDDDEGITVVSNWIIDEMERTGKRPSSKAVRERAREFCHNNEYEIPSDSWLRT
ncbi:hypothetical protein EGH21_23440 [Halomicroarcula sp. F13]|uniref:Uncharacterized protein n=1 Tax=Haloarcula rubra TaxID=2487747 RepID=A0AAW4PZ95_9EURY|nr:hypothetical protein [Halomicroarcula rubra]MBX0325974.1 hypothetical protein [Halomicroarcula rubra]